MHVTFGFEVLLDSLIVCLYLSVFLFPFLYKIQ